MKKKSFAAAMVICCMALLSYSTWSYFTARDTAQNVITSGGIGIEIIEKTKDDQGTELDFPQDGFENIMPGSRVSKIVSVKNIGGNDAWIRVKVDSAILSADGTLLPLELEVHGVSVPVITFAVEDGWISGEDGYYYYSKEVASGEKTEIFFREVGFSLQMGNEYQNCTANLNITAQAVQCANNPIPQGGDVSDVTGWPEN